MAMGSETYEFRCRLYKLLVSMPDKHPLEKMIFRECCRRYQAFVRGEADSPRVTNEELVARAVYEGILKLHEDRKTGERRLPGNRTVRRAMANLVYYGCPVETSSNSKGIAICDDAKKMQDCKKESEKRAKMLFAKSKGYDKATMFILGQKGFEEEVFNAGRN